MKLALCSDLHLEFGPISLTNDENADVLILSGDICVAKDVGINGGTDILGENKSSARVHTFFQECSERFPRVVYIVGNHEHYHGDFAKSISLLRERLAYLPNIHVMDKEQLDVEDVTFLAGTLWTDMNKEDPSTMYHVSRVMNDYRTIENSNEMVSYKAYVALPRPSDMTEQEWIKVPYEQRTTFSFKTRPASFQPSDSVVDHRAMLAFMSERIATLPPDRKVVVVGHHAPSKLSIKPRYAHDHLTNGAYSSDLSEFILDRPCIKLWTHGHTHDIFDYMVGTTRVVCNPRGYIGYESCADDFKLMYLEI